MFMRNFLWKLFLSLKKQNPDAKIIVHPECELPVRMVADFIGSTSALLQYTKKDNGNCYIVATEAGIIHQMKKENPGKDIYSCSSKRFYMRMQRMQFHEADYIGKNIKLSEK